MFNIFSETLIESRGYIFMKLSWQIQPIITLLIIKSLPVVMKTYWHSDVLSVKVIHCACRASIDRRQAMYCLGQSNRIGTLSYIKESFNNCNTLLFVRRMWVLWIFLSVRLLVSKFLQGSNFIVYFILFFISQQT